MEPSYVTNAKRRAEAALVEDDQCEFRTTEPLGAMSQSARYTRGSHRGLRYRRCRNRAKHTIVVPDANLAHPDRTREVRCCGLHKRKHDEEGWMP